MCGRGWAKEFSRLRTFLKSWRASRLGRWREAAWLIAFPLFLFTIAYPPAVAVHVAPESPASAKLRPYSDALIVPRFRQQWTLFAPHLSDTDLVLYFQIRSRGAQGKEEETDLIDLTHRLNEQSRARRFFPSRVNRLASHFAREGADFQRYRLTIEEAKKANPGKPLPPVLVNDLRLREEIIEKQLSIFLSSCAQGFLQTETIQGVRAIVALRQIRPFSERFLREKDPVLIYESDWLPFRNKAPSI